jgi:hypothetical protein
MRNVMKAPTFETQAAAAGLHVPAARFVSALPACCARKY